MATRKELRTGEYGVRQGDSVQSIKLHWNGELEDIQDKIATLIVLSEYDIKKYFEGKGFIVDTVSKHLEVHAK